MLVAQADNSTLQNVLMDALDEGIVNSNNFDRARGIINAPLEGRKRKGTGPDDYTVAAMTQDIATATETKDWFSSEAQGKESRLYLFLDGLGALSDQTFRNSAGGEAR